MTYKAEGLKIGYQGNAIVKPGFNFEIKEGEQVAVTGPNGAGKSTLLRILAGLGKAISGDVLLNNKAIQAYSQAELSKILAFVPTNLLFSSNLTVYELIAHGRIPYKNFWGNLSSNDEKIILEAAKNTDIVHLLDKHVNETSDGEKQRAFVARALAQQTDIIILDEPTAFLDLPNRTTLISFFAGLCRSMGKTIIYSTHDISMALQHADKILCFNRDMAFVDIPENLMKSGAFDKVFNHPSLVFDVKKAGFGFQHPQQDYIHLLQSSKENNIFLEYLLQRHGFKIVDNECVNNKIRLDGLDKGQVFFQNQDKWHAFSSLIDLNEILTNKTKNR